MLPQISISIVIADVRKGCVSLPPSRRPRKPPTSRRYTEHELDAVAATLNRRPRKNLAWKTPSEALDELLSGTSGIGRATAILFAEEGATVAITGRNRERSEEVVSEIVKLGAEGLFITADVRLPKDCERAVEETATTFGGLAVLLDNAGLYYANDAIGCSEEEFDVQVDTSFKGSFLMSKYALPHMIKAGSGSIVNNSSGRVLPVVHVRWPLIMAMTM